jgi:hypothetical protein
MQTSEKAKIFNKLRQVAMASSQRVKTLFQLPILKSQIVDFSILTPLLKRFLKQNSWLCGKIINTLRGIIGRISAFGQQRF